ncbi:MAG: serine/threonine-protein kinase [Thermodesulfobacteriota bacterium]|nr:serine/threonine-protein kinase [Thermodesulfobacteriota bacterium]
MATHFEPGEHLGEGGIAQVRAAHDDSLQRMVALKILRPELADDGDHRERFYREAQILADLDHPGAIPVFEAGTLPNGHCFYSMQKVDGRTLQEFLDDRSKEDILSRHKTAHFIDIFERVCQTVAFAHQRDIIHRDLKPENIMVGELGQVFVIDWGIAKRLATEDDGGDSKTRVGSVMGTPAYMSPEQAEGRSIESDQRTDVFSLGTILYEILVGKQPFRADSAREAFSRVRFHDPDPPRTLDRRTSRTLSAICMKCLHKDPFRRYPSATELTQDLRRYQEHLPVTAIDPRLRDRFYNWVRRRPAWASALGTLAVFVLAIVSGFVFHASIENHIVGNAYDQIDVWQEQRTELGREISRLRKLLDNGSQDPSATRKTLHDLHARDHVLSDLIRGTARGITGLTVYSPEDRATSILRDLFEEKINRLMTEDRFVEVRASLESLKDVHDDNDLFNLSIEDRKWIDQHLKEVERAEGTRSESKQQKSEPVIR